MFLAIGQIMHNRYRVLGPLGQGGMGAVYLAEDLVLGRRCALKENIPDPNASPQVLAQMRQQFQAEARVLARLDHPNLPKVHDYFSAWANEYIVMEYVEGENLASILNRQGGPLPEQVVLRWAYQLLDALAYLHSQHPNPIIHRDIKPANVILTPGGAIKLVDFGLVKLFDPNSPVTATGMRGMGTPQYAPPEQFIAAGHTDARSDLFSLGAMLYHLLTGIAPADAYQRLAFPNLLSPPNQINPAISPSTNVAILRAIELQPDRRYQLAAEMRAALSDTSWKGQASRKKVSYWWAVGVLMLVLVVAASGLGAILLQSHVFMGTLPAATVAVRSASSTETVEPATSESAAIGSPASPPAETPGPTATSTFTPIPTPDVPSAGIAWVTTSDELLIWDSASTEARHVDRLAYSMQWEWSPDGRHIAYQRADSDLFVSTYRDASWRIASTGDFDWSPDGMQLAYLDRSDFRCVLHAVDVDGSNDRVLADLTVPAPDLGGAGGGGSGDYVADFISHKRPFNSSADAFIWWTRDGRSIVVVQDFLQTCRSALVDLTGVVAPCTETLCADEGAASIASSHEPADVFLLDESDALWRYGYRGPNIDYAEASVSSSELIFDQAARAAMINWGFHNNFWLRDAGGNTQRITNTSSFKWLGSWSPDFSWIAYADLIVSDGMALDEIFDAQRAVNLWLLQPQIGESIQLTDHGMLDTFAWQPLTSFAASSLLAGSDRRTRPGPHGVMTASELTVILDGRFDEWTGPWRPLIAAVEGAEQRSDATDIDARSRIGWDKRGLVLAMQVTDDSHVFLPSEPNGMKWPGDGIEIAVDRDLLDDFDQAFSSSDDVLIGISFGPRLSELRAYRWSPKGLEGAIDVSGVIQATSRGYDLEVLIPWDGFFIEASQLGDGQTFGFNLAVHDADGPNTTLRTIVSMSPARLTEDNPTQWGTLLLAAGPGE